MHLTSLESHHSEDLSEAPSFVATAHHSAMASTLDFRTGRKYHYCFCLSSPSVWMPYRLSPEGTELQCVRPCGLSDFRQQKESKKCAVLFSFQRTTKATEKPPHFPCRKVRGLITKKFYFSIIFLNLSRILTLRLCIATCETPYFSASVRSDNFSKKISRMRF